MSPRVHLHRTPTTRDLPTRPSLRVALFVAPVLALVAACGSNVATTPGGSGSASSAASAAQTPEQTSAADSSTLTVSYDPDPVTGTFPVTVVGANGSLTVKAAPHRIVSLSPTATEMLFALGAGPQVVAVDDNSTFPAGAPKTKLSAFQPNAEAVAGYAPDLVVLSNDANGLLKSLGKLHVPALVLPAAATLDESYAQERTLGGATGHLARASKVVDVTKSRIAAAIASVPSSIKGEKVYHELDPTFYSATSSTFIGSVYALFGLKDIADAAKGAAATGGYPQLSAEYVVTQAPDLIVLADTKCCQQSVAALTKRPAFAAVPALKSGKVLAADDDVASRWGPRVADFVEAIATMLRT